MSLTGDPEALIRSTGLLYAAVIGSVIGSFYTATAYRVLHFFYGRERKNKKNLWVRFFTEPSRCNECGTPLRVRELIPVFSYLFLKGRCRTCRKPVGIHVFAGELFTAVLFPLLLLLNVHYTDALILVIVSGHLYISIAVDYRWYQLDWENGLWILFWILVYSGRYFWNGSGYELLPHLYSSLITGLIFLILWLPGKGLGAGDVLFAPLPAFFIPFPYTPVYLSVSSFMAVVWAYSGGRKGKTPIPFGVFLSLGFYITLTAVHLLRVWFSI